MLDVVADDLEPVVLAFLPYGKARQHDEGIVERAKGNRDEIVELVIELAVNLVIDVGSAVGAEVEGGPVAALGDLDEGLRPAFDPNLLLRPARLNRERAP